MSSKARQDAKLEVKGPKHAELELANARIMEAAYGALRDIGGARVADGIDFGLGLDDFGLSFSLSWDEAAREQVERGG
jgi:hypothetical protein